MKYLLLGLFLFSACSAEPSKVTKLSDPLLVNLLVFGEVTDLNHVKDDIDKNLWIKLYQIPSKVENNCFPESHGICAYDYYITTAQLDDSPTYNAYSIGTFGEMIDANWEKTASGEEKAVIRFKVNKYSQLALSFNKKLENELYEYLLVATADDLTFTKKPFTKNYSELVKLDTKSSTTAVSSQAEIPLKISITKQGNYFVEGKEVVDKKPESLFRAISNALDLMDVASPPVIISADADSSYQSVVTAMDIVSKFGLTKFSLATIVDNK